uniref:Uncharacterized protein n=1 Tax=Brassica oleracea TaxID=3712 RepID=A0A3P6CC19_BRAOL|nr:unnamed protein product [Brassica oleracea]
MATINTALQALNVQRPPPPVRDNVEQQDENIDDEDDEANQFAAVDDNPFAPLRNNSALARDDGQEINDGFHWEAGFKTEIPEFHGISSAEELLDWIVTVEDILEFKRAPMEHCVLHIINLFHPLTLSEAHQQALTIETQTISNFSWSASRSTRPAL